MHKCYKCQNCKAFRHIPGSRFAVLQNGVFLIVLLNVLNILSTPRVHVLKSTKLQKLVSVTHVNNTSNARLAKPLSKVLKHLAFLRNMDIILKESC